MKMKAVVATVAGLSFITGSLFAGFGYWFAPVVAAVFLVCGVLRSLQKGLNPLNDVPNALRVFLASVSGLLFALSRAFFGLSLAFVALAAAFLLNDEYQRRALDSLKRGRRGGAVALLGIDGSGKSTHAEALEAWVRERGYHCTRVPFHRYLFVGRLSSAVGGGSKPSGLRRQGNPLRPLLSLADNLLLHVLSSFGRGIEGRVVLYDRYIWSTYVKYQALGYPVRPLRWLYLLPRPRVSIVLDVSVEKSYGVIQARTHHIRYRRDVLSEERGEYLAIARQTGSPVVDATREYAGVQRDLELILSPLFPPIGGGRPR